MRQKDYSIFTIVHLNEFEPAQSFATVGGVYTLCLHTYKSTVPTDLQTDMDKVKGLEVDGICWNVAHDKSTQTRGEGQRNKLHFVSSYGFRIECFYF